MVSTAAISARDTSPIVGKGVESGGDMVAANLDNFLSKTTINQSW